MKNNKNTYSAYIDNISNIEMIFSMNCIIKTLNNKNSLNNTNNNVLNNLNTVTNEFFINLKELSKDSISNTNSNYNSSTSIINANINTIIVINYPQEVSNNNPNPNTGIKGDIHIIDTSQLSSNNFLLNSITKLNDEESKQHLNTKTSIKSYSLMKFFPSLKTKISNVSCNDYIFHATTISGDLFSWGDDDLYKTGILGVGNKYKLAFPLLNEFFYAQAVLIKNLSLSDKHCVATTFDGEVYTWGSGSNGELIEINTYNQNTPLKVKLSMPVIKAIAGKEYTCLLSIKGGVYYYGKLNQKLDLKNQISNNNAMQKSKSKLRLGLNPTLSSQPISQYSNSNYNNNPLTTYNYNNYTNSGITSYTNTTTPSIITKTPIIGLSQHFIKDIIPGTNVVALISESNKLFIYNEENKTQEIDYIKILKNDNRKNSNDFNPNFPPLVKKLIFYGNDFILNVEIENRSKRKYSVNIFFKFQSHFLNENCVIKFSESYIGFSIVEYFEKLFCYFFPNYRKREDFVNDGIYGNDDSENNGDYDGKGKNDYQYFSDEVVGVSGVFRNILSIKSFFIKRSIKYYEFSSSLNYKTLSDVEVLKTYFHNKEYIGKVIDDFVNCICFIDSSYLVKNILLGFDFNKLEIKDNTHNNNEINNDAKYKIKDLKEQNENIGNLVNKDISEKEILLLSDDHITPHVIDNNKMIINNNNNKLDLLESVKANINKLRETLRLNKTKKHNNENNNNNYLPSNYNLSTNNLESNKNTNTNIKTDSNNLTNKLLSNCDIFPPNSNILLNNNNNYSISKKNIILNNLNNLIAAELNTRMNSNSNHTNNKYNNMNDKIYIEELSLFQGLEGLSFIPFNDIDEDELAKSFLHVVDLIENDMIGNNYNINNIMNNNSNKLNHINTEEERIDTIKKLNNEVISQDKNNNIDNQLSSNKNASKQESLIKKTILDISSNKISSEKESLNEIKITSKEFETANGKDGKNGKDNNVIYDLCDNNFISTNNLNDDNNKNKEDKEIGNKDIKNIDGNKAKKSESSVAITKESVDNDLLINVVSQNSQNSQKKLKKRVVKVKVKDKDKERLVIKNNKLENNDDKDEDNDVNNNNVDKNKTKNKKNFESSKLEISVIGERTEREQADNIELDNYHTTHINNKENNNNTINKSSLTNENQVVKETNIPSSTNNKEINNHSLLRKPYINNKASNTITKEETEFINNKETQDSKNTANEDNTNINNHKDNDKDNLCINAFDILDLSITTVNNFTILPTIIIKRVNNKANSSTLSLTNKLKSFDSKKLFIMSKQASSEAFNIVTYNKSNIDNNNTITNHTSNSEAYNIKSSRSNYNSSNTFFNINHSDNSNTKTKTNINTTIKASYPIPTLVSSILNSDEFLDTKITINKNNNNNINNINNAHKRILSNNGRVCASSLSGGFNHNISSLIKTGDQSINRDINNNNNNNNNVKNLVNKNKKLKGISVKVNNIVNLAKSNVNNNVNSKTISESANFNTTTTNVTNNNVYSSNTKASKYSFNGIKINANIKSKNLSPYKHLNFPATAIANKTETNIELKNNNNNNSNINNNKILFDSEAKLVITPRDSIDYDNNNNKNNNIVRNSNNSTSNQASNNLYKTRTTVNLNANYGMSTNKSNNKYNNANNTNTNKNTNSNSNKNKNTTTNNYKKSALINNTSKIKLSKPTNTTSTITKTNRK